MESVFSRFESYDFGADRRFEDGLKNLHESNNESKLLDMKLFFYNRFVEPIDRSSYKQWSSAARLRTLSPPASDISQNRAAETSAETAAAEQQELQQEQQEQQQQQEQQEQQEQQQQELSFAEVRRLVQEGREVPGVTKLDIKPTNESPTPSRMERIVKPWEIPS